MTVVEVLVVNADVAKDEAVAGDPTAVGTAPLASETMKLLKESGKSVPTSEAPAPVEMKYDIRDICFSFDVEWTALRLDA